MNTEIDSQIVRKFSIKDRLLKACIGYGGNLSCGTEVQGFSQGKGFGYGILSVLTDQALEISRAEGLIDPFLRDDPRTSRKVEIFISELSSTQRESVISEIRELYKFTQEHLKNTNQEEIRLFRGIIRTDRNWHLPHPSFLSTAASKKSSYVEKIIEDIKKASKPFFDLEMDSLNSYDLEGNYSYGYIQLEQKINRKNIFYLSDIIDHGTRLTVENEPGEWVVLNRYSNWQCRTLVKEVVQLKDFERQY